MKLLLAVDGARAGEPAARAAAVWASTAGAEVVLYSVLHPREVRSTVAGPRFPHTIAPEASQGGQPLHGVRPPAAQVAEDRSQALARLRVERREYLQHLADRLFAGVPATIRIDDGADTASAIIAAAVEESASVIAMATRGRSALGQALFGAVHEDVVRRSPVPVLLVGPAALELAAPVELA